jgi:hypothetical protein
MSVSTGSKCKRVASGQHYQGINIVQQIMTEFNNVVSKEVKIVTITKIVLAI